MNDNPWIENNGTVPEGVGHDTVIEVEYRDGSYLVLKYWSSDDIRLWTLDDDAFDILRWRFV